MAYTNPNANGLAAFGTPAERKAPKKDITNSYGMMSNPVAPTGNAAYKPTTAPFGFDQTMPGVQEQHWENNQNLWTQSPNMDWVQEKLPEFENPTFGEQYGKDNLPTFGQPGQGQQFWNQVAGTFNTQGTYSGPNNSQQAFNSTNAAIPQSLVPTFNSYYDRAKETAVGDMNSQAAARGVYGSSQTLNNVGNVITDIEAQRANRLGDFSLADSENQRNWRGLAGQQASNADDSGINQFDADLRGIGTYGNMAFNAEGADYNRDTAGFDIANSVGNSEMDRRMSGIETAMGLESGSLQRLIASFGASGEAQDQRDDRLGTQFDQTRAQGNDLADYFTQMYDDLLNTDQEMMTGGVEGDLGASQNNVNDDRYNQERLRRDLKDIIDVMTASQQNKKS